MGSITGKKSKTCIGSFLGQAYSLEVFWIIIFELVSLD
jgi:hypothetical protein